MASPGVRSTAASIVGWLIVALVVVLLFAAFGGLIGFVLRTAAVILLIGGLMWLWFRLKAGPD